MHYVSGFSKTISLFLCVTGDVLTPFVCTCVGWDDEDDTDALLYTFIVGGTEVEQVRCKYTLIMYSETV